MAESNLMADVLAPPELRSALERESASWTRDERVGRLWQRDPAVWRGGDEGRWLGWLDVPDPEGPEVRRLEASCISPPDGFVSAALLGMGGSSLFPRFAADLRIRAGGSAGSRLGRSGPRRAFEDLDIDRIPCGLQQVGHHAGDESGYATFRTLRSAPREAAGARSSPVTVRARLDAWHRPVPGRVPRRGDIGGRSRPSNSGCAGRLVGLACGCCSTRARPWRSLRSESPAVPPTPGVQLGLLLGLAARAVDKARCDFPPLDDRRRVEQMTGRVYGKGRPDSTRGWRAAVHHRLRG